MIDKPPILDFFDKLKYSKCFIRVRDSIIAGQYEHAMTAVDEMFDIYKEKKPSENVKIQLNLIFGMVSWNLHRHDDVYKACKMGLNQITQELKKKQNTRKLNELKYLRGYCKTLIGFSDANGGVRSGYDFQEVDGLLAPDYDLKQVSAFLKRTFPIDDTSWWNWRRSQV
ncbi:MAG: hypothetical protein H0X27_08690 [Caulobacteraceae bacterium]|nr:hypothetical protein [Caulobacteraceae bacterium]